MNKKYKRSFQRGYEKKLKLTNVTTKVQMNVGSKVYLNEPTKNRLLNFLCFINCSVRAKGFDFLSALADLRCVAA